MTALAIINSETESPTISGRELHEKLEIKTAYKDWFPRMCEYGFTENQDFTTELKTVLRADGAIMPQQQADHSLTLDMAKEICMLQRTEQGKAVRRYLLDIERQWNTPELVMSRALRMANARMEELTGKVLTLQAVNSDLAVRNQIMAPKAEYFDDLVDRGVNTSLRETTKELRIKERTLVNFLITHKYIYRDKRGKLMPYAQYVGDLFAVKECFNEKTSWGGTQTLVTPKGREALRQLTAGLC